MMWRSAYLYLVLPRPQQKFNNRFYFLILRFEEHSEYGSCIEVWEISKWKVQVKENSGSLMLFTIRSIWMWWLLNINCTISRSIKYVSAQEIINNSLSSIWLTLNFMHVNYIHTAYRSWILESNYKTKANNKYAK